MSNQGASLAELFGYFEDSESNTMALVRKVSSFWIVCLGYSQLFGSNLSGSWAGGVPRISPFVYFILIFSVFGL